MGNRLLESLSAEDMRRISPDLRQVSLRSRQTVLQHGQPVREIVFPLRGICSVLKTTGDGHTIEVLGIGSEGAIGASVALGQAESPGDVIVPIPDEGALALSVVAFRAEVALRGALFSAVMRYCESVTRQLMQTTACNARHSADARCRRWLLTTHDRLDGGSLPVTHEMLAMLLGVRRPTVTLIMAGLQREGLVACSRGTIAVLDADALAQRACECYRALSPRFSKVA